MLNFCRFVTLSYIGDLETEYLAGETAMSRERTGIFPYEYMGKFEKEVLNSEAGKMRSRCKGFVENKHLLENAKYTEQ